MAFIVRNSPLEVNNFGETLTETRCEKSQEWTDHKKAADAIGWAVRSVLGENYGRSLAQCSTQMHLQRSTNIKDKSIKARPFMSCRKRWCPVCSWRLSMKRWGQLVEKMPDLVEANGPLAFLMLTLTVRNCQASELKDTVRDMLRGWRKMTQHDDFPARGWLRSLEVTFPRGSEAHPHIHILLAVKADYFSNGYISKEKWTNKWQKAMKLDYEPIVDIRRVKPMEKIEDKALAEALGGLKEVSKYVTKPADLADRPEAAIEGLAALRRVRMIEGGGFMKGIFADAEEEDPQEDLPEMESIATFWWRAAESVYRRKL